MSAETAENPFRQQARTDRTPPPCAFVLFGSTGDLARRKIVPALGRLAELGLLPGGFSLLGVGRREKSDEAFRDEIRPALEAAGAPPEVTRALLGTFHYARFDPADDSAPRLLDERLRALDEIHGTAGERLFYLSIPPTAFPPVVRRLGEYRRLAGESLRGCRIVVEKPFGRDLASARALNRLLREVFSEPEIYRIDHYLGKETVQNVLVLRFANAIFEPLWNRRYVDHVQISVGETLGVEDRAGYYEEAGALRDMVQNHILQLLCLVAMEPPATLDPEAIRDERMKVLQSLKRPRPKDAARVAVRGQYGPGSIGGKKVPGYREEKGVRPESTTETYVALRLEVENWRWAGVPFYLRTGKRLPKKVSEVAIRYKDIPHRLFGDGGSPEQLSNVLALRIQPDEGISLRFNSKVPGFEIRIRPVKMDFQYGTSFGGRQPEAYERLLLDAMLGDPTLFIRGDVAEEAWTIVEPILEAWSGETPNFPNYAAGSVGPEEADELLAREGRVWRRL